MEKTEFSSVVFKSDPKIAVREAVNSEKYDEYRKLWDDVSNLKIVTDFPLQLDFE